MPPSLDQKLDRQAQHRLSVLDERGLATSTVKHYLRCARTFLTGLSGPLEEALAGLPAGQVIDVVRDWSTRPGSPGHCCIERFHPMHAVNPPDRFVASVGFAARRLAGADEYRIRRYDSIQTRASAKSLDVPRAGSGSLSRVWRQVAAAMRLALLRPRWLLVSI